MSETVQAEEFQFQAEMAQLLHLITHSLYSHREIFLRELISNSSDALNKLHFASLTESGVLGEDTELKIGIELDEEKKTLAILDNGIGMNKEELIANIGTIASSGTSKFISSMTGDANKDVEMIGRFGVGFYSVFMVADEVVVETSSYKEDKAYRWTSSGTGTFTIEEIEKTRRGTKISFTFKEDAAEFATKYSLENIIKKYSDFVSFPIELNGEKANKSAALWARPKSEITEEEYKEFFKLIGHGFGDPMAWLHLSAEAPVQFKSILYIPEEPDRFLFTEDFDTKLQLYARRVFIQNDCKDLLPKWLRFINGVVDSEDLELNVSREFTQQGPLLAKIQTFLVKKVLGLLKDWAEKDIAKYNGFYEKFGNFIKEGIHADYSNKEKLSELYRAHSSQAPQGWISLKEYVERMSAEQTEIYYAFGKNQSAIENSANFEYFKKNNIEVLYLNEEIDEFVLSQMGTYKEKAIISIDKADLSLDDKNEKTEEEKKDALPEESQEKILGYFKDILGDRVEEVVESKRLVDSAATLVASKNSMGAQMERMMKMMDKGFSGTKRVMEVNLKHPLVKALAGLQHKRPQDPLLKDCIEQLYEAAALAEGGLEDPSSLAPRSTRLMEMAAELYLKSLDA